MIFSVANPASGEHNSAFPSLWRGLRTAYLPHVHKPGPAGLAAVDMLGRQHCTGSLTYALLRTGYDFAAGRCFYFNGSSHSAVNYTPGSAMVSFDEDLTISYWFYFGSTSGSQFLVGETDVGLGSRGWQVYLSSGTIKHQFYTDAGLQQIYTPASPSTGFWRLCTIRKRGTTASVQWSSGEAGSNTTSGTYQAPTTHGFCMGSTPGLPTYWLNGRLGPIHTWQRYLEDSEVTSMERHGASPFVPVVRNARFAGWDRPVFANRAQATVCVT